MGRIYSYTELLRMIDTLSIFYYYFRCTRSLTLLCFHTGPDVLTPLAALTVTAGHVAIAVACGARPWRVTFAAAAVAGGLLAFDLQALNHELSHQTLRVVATRSTVTSYASDLLVRIFCNRPVSNICGLLASAATTVPWFAYYFAGGHALHHMVRGVFVFLATLITVHGAHSRPPTARRHTVRHR